MNVDESTTNSQITDAVTQVNTSNVGQAAAATQALLDAVMAEAVGMGMHNAVTTQQNSQMVGSAAVTATCARILQAQGLIYVPPPGPPQPLIPIVPPPRTAAEQAAQGQVAEEQILNEAVSVLEANESLTQSAVKELKKLFSGSASDDAPATPPKSSGKKR